MQAYVILAITALNRAGISDLAEDCHRPNHQSRHADMCIKLMQGGVRKRSPFVRSENAANDGHKSKTQSLALARKKS